MNLKDLSKIDIKELQNIDWNDMRDRIFSQPHVFLNILLSVITVFVLLSTFNKFTSAAKKLKADEVLLTEKLSALEKFNAAQAEHTHFLDNASKAIDDDQLIETLSEFAFRRNVKIISFSPAKKRSNALTVLTSVDLNVTAENFDNIILFIHDIENSSYAIRIGEWSGRLADQYGRDANKKDTSSIRAIIKIESLELKNV